MSNIESSSSPSSVRLEEGEIDEEGGEPSTLCTPSAGECADGGHEGVVNAENATDNDGKTPSKMAIDNPESPRRKKQSGHPSSSTYKSAHYNENNSEFLDEDEMLCVRGASPTPFLNIPSHFPCKSPPYETDRFSPVIVSPKKRRTSRIMRRRKRRGNRKRIPRERSASSSDDQTKAKSKQEIETPHPRPKLQQVCKFYILEWCVKGQTCEYMHSEFPCKFFYLGLECEDEMTNGMCKLSHGGVLSCEMLIALIRHIRTAPNEVLGQRFVELRSKMAVGEVNKLINKMQAKLQSTAKATESSIGGQNADLNSTLNKKLYFLTEEQADKLQSLGISQAEDLLSLTLAQLNAIGIHAIQIEAIQMSLSAGHDTDMREIPVPPPTEPPKPGEGMEEKGEEVMGSDANWYDEEKPLVIDETENGDSEGEEIKSDGDGTAEVIDVVGCSSSGEFSPLSSDDGGQTQKVDISSLISRLDRYSAESSTEFAEEGETANVDRVDMEIETTDETCGPETTTETKETEEIEMDFDIFVDDLEREELQLTGNQENAVESIFYSDNTDEVLFSKGSCPELPMRTPNLDNYKPALEIDAHLTYPPMKYKLYDIYLPDTEVNKPPLLDKLLRANSTDPRLKKFLEKEKNHGIFPQTDYSFFPPNSSQSDPRLRTNSVNPAPSLCYNASSIIYGYLQRSIWYQKLKSNLKIEINHSVSNLIRALNAFHKDQSPEKIFDLFQIESAGVLLEVRRNVGIFIDVNGQITEERDYPQLCAPQQASQAYNNDNGGEHRKLN